MIFVIMIARSHLFSSFSSWAGIRFAGFALPVLLMLMVSTPVRAEANYNGITSAPIAFDLLKRQVVKLIDIRRPSEWRQTGVGRGAHKISMHQSGFLARLDALVSGDRSQPIALICARGQRSRYMKAQLNQLGFTNVTDVSEGMLGSPSGPGWLKRKLPLN